MILVVYKRSVYRKHMCNMDGKIINSVLVVLAIFVCYSELLVPENTSGFSLTIPGNYSCVTQLPNGNYTFATNCTNGKGLKGCCVDRGHCNYNTSNIDLTMYAPRGYKKPCFEANVCCPFKNVLPIIVTNSTGENKFDTDIKDDDDDDD